jgi:hypothetical protein
LKLMLILGNSWNGVKHAYKQAGKEMLQKAHRGHDETGTGHTTHKNAVPCYIQKFSILKSRFQSPFIMRVDIIQVSPLVK